MDDHIYKHIQLTGTSSKSSDDAIQNAIAKAAKTVHSMRWFEVVEMRGSVGDGKVQQWQVILKVAFRLDE